MADPLEIARGSNRGEAAFLGESSFDAIRNAERAGNMIRQEKERENQELIQNAALLDDNVKAQWDTDAFNYFNPKVNALKDETLKLFKQTNGRLNPLQKVQIQRQWDALKNEADISNATFKAFSDQVKKLEGDKQGYFDKEQSRMALEQLKNPQNFPELKKEIDQQYGGNVLKWRADNAQRFSLVPSFGEDAYYQALTKDEMPQIYQRKGENGKMYTERLPNGDFGYYEGKKLSDNQVNTLTGRIWNSTQWQDKKAQEQAARYVDGRFSILPNGSVGVPAELPDSEKQFANAIIKRAGNLRGLNTNEIKRALSRAYTAEQIASRRGEGEQLKVLNVDQNRGSGQGKGFKDKYTVTEVPYNESGNFESMQGLLKQMGGFDPAKQNAAYLNPLKDGTARIVAIEPNKQGADTESIQLNINGKQVRPVNYIVNDKTGEVYGTFAERVAVPYDDTGVQKIRYEDQVNDFKLDEKQMVNIAARYGFGGKDGVARFKREVLGLQPQSSSNNDPFSKWKRPKK